MADKKIGQEGNGTPQTAQASGTTSPAGGMTKREAVRQALKALGKKAQPLEIKKYLMDHFNLDMSRDLISKYKSDLVRMAKGKKKPANKEAPTAPPEAAPVPAPVVKETGNGKAVFVEDVLLAKDLVKRVGREALHTLIDAFAG